MKRFDHEMSRLLRQSAKFVGIGSFTGHLYDLGAYPGAIYDPKSEIMVYGELYRLNELSAHTLLSMLDSYEGITGSESDEYYRSVISISHRREVIESFVYILRDAPLQKHEIKGGDYYEYHKNY